MGEHNSYFKHTIYYEGDTRIPLIIYVPNIDGKRVNILASNMDLFPTIFELLNLNKPENLDAISLVPAFNNDIGVRSYLFIQYYDSLINKSVGAAVRDDFNKLVINLDGTIECYNLIKDPAELNKNGCAKETYERLNLYLMETYNNLGLFMNVEKPEIISNKEKKEILNSLNYVG
jgi:arylsulfatase A-like enzyme